MDKERFAYKLQVEILASLYARETQCPIRDIYVFERSMFSSLHIFAHLNCNDSNYQQLKTLQKQQYSNIWQNATIIYIYIRTPFSICYERIQKRKKSTDGNIDIDYLQQLEKLHDDVFVKNFGAKYVIDGNASMDKVFFELVKIIKTYKIKKFY